MRLPTASFMPPDSAADLDEELNGQVDEKLLTEIIRAVIVLGVKRILCCEEILKIEPHFLEFIRRHSLYPQENYFIVHAVYLLYCVKKDKVYSPYMQDLIRCSFSTIFKNLVKKENEKMTAEIAELKNGLINAQAPLSKACYSKAPVVAVSEAPQQDSVSINSSGSSVKSHREELAYIKQSVSVKTIIEKFSTITTQKNSLNVEESTQSNSNHQSKDFYNPFYESDADADSSSLCTSRHDESSLNSPHVSASTCSNGKICQKSAICFARALYPYEKMNDDELSFPEDALIAVYRKNEDLWWLGEYNGLTGWFPSTYSAELSKSVVLKNYSNQVIKGHTVYITKDSDEWNFVYVPDCEWSGLVPTTIFSNEDSSSKLTMLSPSKSSVAVASDGVQNLQSQVVSELIASDQRFVHNLSLVVHFYYKPLKIKWSDSEISQLFSNICDVLEFAIVFCNDLSLCQNGMMVANLFLKSNFDVYIAYCTSQSSSLDYYEKRLKVDKDFLSFLNDLKNQPELRGMDLNGFLLEPMQRITRYPLLLNQLLKHATNQSEKDNVKLALEKIQGSIQTLNSAIRDQEKELKMKTLFSKLSLNFEFLNQYTFDFTNGTKNLGQRKLIFDGIPEKIKGFSKKCKVYLFNDMILFCSVPKSISSSVFLMRAPICTADVRILTDVTHSSPFTVDIAYFPIEPTSNTSQEEVMTFYFATKSEKNEWITALNKVFELIKISEIAKLDKQTVTVSSNISGGVGVSYAGSNSVLYFVLKKLAISPLTEYSKVWRYPVIFGIQLMSLPSKSSTKPIYFWPENSYGPALTNQNSRVKIFVNSALGDLRPILFSIFKHEKLVPNVFLHEHALSIDAPFFVSPDTPAKTVAETFQFSYDSVTYKVDFCIELEIDS